MPPKKSNGRGPPAPTAGDVVALFQTRQNDGQEARLRSLAEAFRTLVRMDHDVRIPETYKAITREVRTPFVRDAWLRTTAALTQNPWLPHVDPRSESDRSKRAAGIAERWMSAATSAMDKDIRVDVPYEACAAMVRDCESVIKVVHRPDAWASFPVRELGEDPSAYLEKAEAYKKGSPIPFAWRNIDRLSYLPGDGEWGDSYCIEYGEYSRAFLANRYRMRADPESGRLVGAGHDEEGRTVKPADLEGKPTAQGFFSGSTGMSVKLEYFDAEWWCVVVDGSMAPGWPKENPYAPRLPYMRAKPSDEPEAVLYSLLFLVPRLDELLTMWLNWCYLGAYANPYLEDLPNTNTLPSGMMPPTGDENTPATFTWGPGKFLEIPRGKRFAFMQPPPIGGDLKEMALLFRSLIDIAGIPSILRGANLSGDSGYLANQMIASATMLYRRLQRARERQLEEALEFMLYLIPHRVKQTVYVLGQGAEGRAWLGLREKGETTEALASTDQLGPLTVEARPDMSVMQQARAMIAKQLIDGPPETRLDSRRHAMEHWLGFEDPDTLIDEIWVEDTIATDPAIRKMIVDDATRRAGLSPPPSPSTNGLVGPNGQPLLPPDLAGVMAGIPGALQGGLPVSPGAGMPVTPPGPQGGVLPGGRVSGTFPGQPPNSPVGV